MNDLKVGMTLEGVVTNVTAFGAFVDVGVHQDGLVHISQLADRFVKDPHEVVKAGDRLKVRVLEVDLERKRIALTAKSEVPRGQAPQPKVQERTPLNKGGVRSPRSRRGPSRPSATTRLRACASPDPREQSRRGTAMMGRSPHVRRDARDPRSLRQAGAQAPACLSRGQG